MTQQLESYLLEQQETGEPDDVIHYVHTECQQSAPFFVTMCAIALDKDDDMLEDDEVDCDPCIRALRCPACGGLMVE